MNASALPDGLYRWQISPSPAGVANGLTRSVAVVAGNASSAWAKFVAQRFGVLKPDRKDYVIRRTS